MNVAVAVANFEYETQGRHVAKGQAHKLVDEVRIGASCVRYSPRPRVRTRIVSWSPTSRRDLKKFQGTFAGRELAGLSASAWFSETRTCS